MMLSNVCHGHNMIQVYLLSCIKLIVWYPPLPHWRSVHHSYIHTGDQLDFEYKLREGSHMTKYIVTTQVKSVTNLSPTSFEYKLNIIDVLQNHQQCHQVPIPVSVRNPKLVNFESFTYKFENLYIFLLDEVAPEKSDLSDWIPDDYSENFKPTPI